MNRNLLTLLMCVLSLVLLPSCGKNCNPCEPCAAPCEKVEKECPGCDDCDSDEDVTAIRKF